MKKILAATIAVLMILEAAAIGSAEAHTHVFAEEWNRDLTQHWHECECGERKEPEAHALDDGMICTVCGSEVWDWGEGFGGDVSNYNEYGDVVRHSSFDGDGLLIDDYTYQMEYDADGNKTREATYYGDFLVEEVLYAMNELGEWHPSVQTGYQEDGFWSVNEYDDHGNIVRAVSYDAENTALFDTVTEYVYDEAYMILETRVDTRYGEEGGYREVINQYGDSVLSVFYNAAGETEYESCSEYEYDEDGNRLSAKGYEDGRLAWESVYALSEDEFGAWSWEKTYTEYLEDGSRNVYEYDEEGRGISETGYDAEGEIILTLNYDYTTDEDGNLLWHACYENDRLIWSVQYEMIEDEYGFWSYEALNTEYNEDGTMYIRELDENGELISEGLFDKDGEPIAEEDAA